MCFFMKYIEKLNLTCHTILKSLRKDSKIKSWVGRLASLQQD